MARRPGDLLHALYLMAAVHIEPPHRAVFDPGQQPSTKQKPGRTGSADRPERPEVGFIAVLWIRIQVGCVVWRIAGSLPVRESPARVAVRICSGHAGWPLALRTAASWDSIDPGPAAPAPAVSCVTVPVAPPQESGPTIAQGPGPDAGEGRAGGRSGGAWPSRCGLSPRPVCVEAAPAWPGPVQEVLERCKKRQHPRTRSYLERTRRYRPSPSNEAPFT